MAPRALIGALASDLLDARRATLAAEERVTELLHDLFPEWRRLFPLKRGWRWSPPHTLDVYGAIDSPAAAQALALAGFLISTIHNHSARRSRCACTTREFM